MTSARKILLGGMSALTLAAACSITTLGKDTKNECVTTKDCTGTHVCQNGVCVTTLSGGNTLPPAECRESGVAHPYYSLAELEGLMVARWLYCGGVSLGPDDQVGVELTSDQHFYFLRVVGGVVVRGTAFGYSGTWAILELSQGSFQLNLSVPNGGTYILHPAFEDYPRRMFLLNLGSTAIYAYERPVQVDGGVDGGTGDGSCGTADLSGVFDLSTIPDLSY